MINRVELKNFGPIEELDWNNLGKINLIIGNNDCGKSFLLKGLYSAMRTIEDYKRNENPNSVERILIEKLHWTFQADEIGNLVTRLDKQSKDILSELSYFESFGEGKFDPDDEQRIKELEKIRPKHDMNLSFSLTLNEQKFAYGFDKNFFYYKEVSIVRENHITPRSENSIFLPTKEVLSIYDIVFESRKNFKFGFDDTYFDLVSALTIKPRGIFSIHQGDPPEPPERGFNSNDFNNARKKLVDIVGGKVEFDEGKKRWYFKKNESEERFPMGITAEGVKKIAILEYLLGNGYLSENSIIFIDEPESALHPEAISKLLDIIAILANHGIQFFMASHSYFVINKLFLIAQEQKEQKLSIPVLSKVDNMWQQYDLLNEMPKNPIIDESIRLYEEEVDLAFK